MLRLRRPSRTLGAALLVAVAAGTLTATPAHAAEGEPIRTGNYVYDRAPNDGSSPDRGTTDLVPLATGALTDGAVGTSARWFGDGTSTWRDVNVVFDLQRDYPLRQIVLTSNAPNAYWGIRAVSVRVRSEADPGYTPVYSQQWYGTASPLPAGTQLNNTLTLDLADRAARFVIVRITRLHEYHHLPLNEVALVQGSGQPGADPAPPLTATELRAEIGKPVKQVPRPGFADEGNYYASVPPDDGTPDNAGGLTAFPYGKLFDRDRTGYAGWRGRADAPKAVTIVFDLLRDYPLDQIRFYSKAPNQYWGFDEMTVSYRPEASATYRIATRAARARTQLDYQLDIPMGNQTARFVRIAFSRVNQYLHIPVSEVEFAVGAGPVGQDPAPPLTVDGMREELTRDTRLVDAYGQYLYQGWPGKVTSDAQLRQEAQDEAERLAGVAPDTTRYDRYGGLKSLGYQGATGYFRLTKIDDRWWFVTPDGYPFFLKGVDSMSPEEWGYGTLYRNPDGTPRDVFDELPDPAVYPDAYAKTDRGPAVSFVKANLMRKYGSDFEPAWRDITYKRMVDWGFNAQSKWTRDPQIKMPYIDQVTAPADAIRVLWAIDPFDPQFAAKLAGQVEALDLKGRKHDRYLIGYFFDNERGWDNEVVAEVLRQGAALPAKRAFVQYLRDTYAGDLARVNQLLGTSAESFDALADVTIELARVPAADVTAFITRASVAYYSTIQRAIKKADPHHLFLGSALVPTWHSSLAWNVGGRDYLDAISLDVYTDSASYLREYEPYDKPVLNLEFSFNTYDRGMRAINAAARADSIAQRGAKYRSFVEAQAASPVFVGSGWFVYYDQAVSGRPGDGESYNFGLVNQQDQPYTEMIDIMRETHRTVELVHQQGAATGPAVNQ
ncbi:hypothetical protein AB0F68_31850 [Micromonospora sp. NPDC023966]|uniref:hypothetical protein n=1 Tax=Micromonospora sp. NPDC023966 TaxID=3154699 RepID=UPI00340F25E4